MSRVDNNSEYGKELQAAWKELDGLLFEQYAKMQGIARKYEAEDEDGNPHDTTPWMAMDWVIVFGLLAFDEDGDRLSATNMMVKNGDQPKYITDGLLIAGSDHAEEIKDLLSGGKDERY